MAGAAGKGAENVAGLRNILPACRGGVFSVTGKKRLRDHGTQ